MKKRLPDLSGAWLKSQLGRCLLISLGLLFAAQIFAARKTFAQDKSTPDPALAQNAAEKVEQAFLIVVGAEGTPEFGEQFSAWASQWTSALVANPKFASRRTVGQIGGDTAGEASDRERMKNWIAEHGNATHELWIILIGHGTDDRKSSKFNLRGPDVSAAELAAWLAPVEARKVIVNCASASGSWLSKLKSENQIVITATKSASQHNFARFGGYLAKAVSDPALDLDKDDQTSLLEAFVAAARQTSEFYETEVRLATEMATLDDNGDGRGTPANWFEGTRVVKKAKQGEPDGLSANQVFLNRSEVESRLTPEQRKSRNLLESKLEALRQTKSSLTEEEYFASLEPILVDLATLYASADSKDDASPDDSNPVNSGQEK